MSASPPAAPAASSSSPWPSDHAGAHRGSGVHDEIRAVDGLVIREKSIVTRAVPTSASPLQ
jgi:hypothetical protein